MDAWSLHNKRTWLWLCIAKYKLHLLRDVARIIAQMVHNAQIDLTGKITFPFASDKLAIPKIWKDKDTSITGQACPICLRMCYNWYTAKCPKHGPIHQLKYPVQELAKIYKWWKWRCAQYLEYQRIVTMIACDDTLNIVQRGVAGFLKDSIQNTHYKNRRIF